MSITDEHIFRGRVIDGTGRAPIDDGVVVVIGERIAWVGAASDLPQPWRDDTTANVVMAGEGTIMPGIVDAHCHISYGEPRSEEELAMYGSAEWRAIVAGWNARKVLRAGVTSASDPAAVYRVPTAVRDAIDAGLIEGPRFAVAGPEITTHQGLGDAFPNWIANPPGNASVLVRNKDEMLEAVRLQIKDTVDFVKVAGSGDATSYYNPLVGCAFRLDELQLIADEVHRLGRKCTIHARSAESVTFAARAGFDWIMHASFMDEEGLELVAERAIPICPTLPLLVNALEATGAEMSAASRDGLKREIDEGAANIRRAFEAGVPIMAGSESGFSLTPYGHWHAKEMEILVTHAGLTPLEAITAGTLNAAKALPRWEAEIGSLEPGKLADVLVVDGDPSKDISVLGRRGAIRSVMQAGRDVDLTPMPDRVQQRFERQHVYFDGLHRNSN
jgi:imidazolonepropionase-like amidohydrolase